MTPAGDALPKRRTNEIVTTYPRHPSPVQIRDQRAPPYPWLEGAEKRRDRRRNLLFHDPSEWRIPRRAFYKEVWLRIRNVQAVAAACEHAQKPTSAKRQGVRLTVRPTHRQ